MADRPTHPRQTHVQVGSWVGLAALGAVAAAVGLRPIEDGDLFWNLAIGRWLLTHHSLLPAIDPFTYNAGAAPVQHEWLAQALLAWIVDVGGLASLRLLGGAWCAGVAAVAFLALRRRGAGDAVALAGASLWWLFAAPHAVVRPHLLAWLPAWLFVGWVLDAPNATATSARIGAARAWPFRTISPKRLAVGVVIVGVWGNLHASVLLAPAWCAAMVFTALLISVRSGRPVRDAVAPWAAHLLWTSAAASLQPAGWTLVAYALHTPAVNQALSNEWWPLLRADVWASRPFLLVAWAALGVAVAVGLVGAVRQPIWPPRAPGPLLASAAVAHAALTRRMSVFLLLPVLWLVDRLASRRAPWPLTPQLALLVAALCLVAVAPETRGWHQPATLRPGAFPTLATTFVDHAGLGGRPLHPDGWGGYLSWRLDGRVQTYADGRWPLVGAQVIADGVKMLTRQQDAGPVFTRYRIDWLMQPTSLYLRVPPPDPKLWALAWQDADTVVLLRRGPAFSANSRRVCAFYRAWPTLRPRATWPMRARGPAGVAVPTDVPSALSLCQEPPP